MYIIDDANATIQYFTGPIGIPWNHKVPGMANNTADATKCYDQTYTVNQNMCSQSDLCHFQIPFTGSGISLFVIQSRDPLNASMTLDGNVSTIATMDALPGPGNPLAYNITLYSVQSLAATDHTLDIALLNYIYSNGTTSKSSLRFDSAAVNETSPSVVSPSASGAGNGSPTSNVPAPSGSSRTSNSHLPIGPIVGGAAGGLTLIVAIIVALVFCRRRKPPQGAAAVHHFETRPATFNPPSALHPSHLPSSAQFSQPSPYDIRPLKYNAQPLAYATPSTSSLVNGHNSRHTNSYMPSEYSDGTDSSSSGLVPRGSTTGTSSNSSTKTQLFAVNPETRPLLSVPQTYITESFRYPEAQSSGSAYAPVPTSSPPPALAGNRPLTEEQANVINTLRNSNVPPAEIARLMDMMRSQREEGMGASSSHVDPMLEAGAPPRYDFKDPN